jgi:hypothetical protein
MDLRPQHVFVNIILKPTDAREMLIDKKTLNILINILYYTWMVFGVKNTKETD